MSTEARGSIFILGGGLMQLPAIAAAEDLGLVRHMADGNAACAGRGLVEHFYHVDLRDLDRLLETARTIDDLRAVFTAGTDFSRSVAYIIERLGLPGIPYEVASRATDKGLMRSVLSAAGVRVPRYHVVSDRSAAPDFEPPYVVKPVDSMGARGVVRVDRNEELTPAVENAQKFSATNRAIVEELIDGQEYSIDALVIDGEIIITGIGIRHIFFEPYFVELGHTIPASLSDREYDVLVAEFRRAVYAIGITRGAAKGDVFLSTDKEEYVATIGEIAARLSGGFMSGWTFPYATGIPLTRLGIEVALGGPVSSASVRPQYDLVSAERALISAPGTIRAIEVEPVDDDRIRDLFIHYSSGDSVAPPENNVEKVANVIAVAADRKSAENAAIRRLAGITIVLETGHPISDAFILGDGWRSRYCRYRVTVQRLVEFLNGTSRNVVGASHRRQKEHGIAVRPISSLGATFEDLHINHFGLDASTLADRITERYGIIWDEDAVEGITRVFWRAFLAAGEQGVRYLMDTLAAEGAS